MGTVSTIPWHWVHVSQGMPAVDQQVWVSFIYPGFNDEPETGFAIYLGDSDWYMDVENDGTLLSRSKAVQQGLDVAVITHWMPLPPKPRRGVAVSPEPSLWQLQAENEILREGLEALAPDAVLAEEHRLLDELTEQRHRADQAEQELVQLREGVAAAEQRLRALCQSVAVAQEEANAEGVA